MRFRSTIIALLWPCLALLAQKPLAIGDAVPDISFETVSSHTSKKEKFSDYKGKLVILDFWAGWCTSCLHAFPKLDSLQSLYEGKVKILLVNAKNTGDDLSKVQAFFTKWETRTGKPFALPTLVDDTTLDKLFPHRLIPHYAWISKEGRLLALSSSDAVSRDNIQSALRGEQLSFTMKKDQDAARPLFSTADLPVDKLVSYCIFLKEWFDGLPSGNRIREKGDVVCGRAMTNTSLLDMYKAIAAGLDPALTGRRVLVLTKDSSALFPPAGSEERDAWYKGHAYTLDILVPAEEASHLYSRMLEVLNAYSGYTGSFEKRKIKCLVLTRSSPGKNLASKGGASENHLPDKDHPYLKFANISQLVRYLNNAPALREPVLNETGYSGNIDLEIERGFSDPESIRRNLHRNGLSLKKEERVVRLFVVKRNKG